MLYSPQRRTHNESPTCQNLLTSAVRSLRRSCDYVQYISPLDFVGRKRRTFQCNGNVPYIRRIFRLDSVAHLFPFGDTDVFEKLDVVRTRFKNLSDSVLRKRRYQRTLGLACAGAYILLSVVAFFVISTPAL